MAAEKHGSERVVVSSFTRTAAAVIGARVQLPDRNVGTIHAHCYRSLGSPTIAETKTKEWNEHVHQDPRYTLTAKTKDHIDDLGSGYDQKEEHGGDESLAAMSALRARMAPDDLYTGDVIEFRRKWLAWKREANYVDFTDLLELALESVECAPGDPAVLVLDEAQDCSPLEWALMRKWGARVEDSLIVAGDPLQSIFGFKGAEPKSFYDPPIPDDHYRFLTQSYRLSRAVHERAVAWIRQSSTDRLHKYLPATLEVCGQIGRDYEGEVDRANLCGEQMNTYRHPDLAVQRMVSDVKKTMRTHMYMATCSYMLQRICSVLREEGVPFHNPYRVTNGAWNPMRGAAQRVRSFIEAPRPDLLGLPRKPCFWSWPDFARWSDDLVASTTFARGSKTEIAARARDDVKLARDKRPPLTASECQRIFTPAAFVALKAALSTNKPWTFFRDRILASHLKSWEYALAVVENFGAFALIDTPRVIVGTVHSCKGGESDHVWLAPDLSPSAHDEWQAGGEEQDAVRRVFYVGMTRAKENLVLLGESDGRSVEWR